MNTTIQPAQERKGFTFYRSYYEAISLLPADDQLTVYKAIMEYSLNGTIPNTKEMPLCARLLIMAFMPNLEANNRRYANGTRGGEARKANPTPKENYPETPTDVTTKQTESKTEAKPKQEESKRKANENDNDNDNENDDVNENEKGNADVDVDAKVGAEARVASPSEVDTSAAPPTLTPREISLRKFEQWASQYTPTLLQFAEPMTASQLAELRAKYTDQKIKDCAAQMHNKSAYMSNRSAFLTMRKWIQSVK